MPHTNTLINTVHNNNDLFGDYPFTDKDRVLHTVMHELPEMVRSNESYQNAIQNSDIQNARSECEDATKTAVNRCITSDMELFRAFTENEMFRKWVMNLIFSQTYGKVPRICDGT